MPRDRFLALLAFWHIADNTQMPARDSPEHDKMFKARTFFDHLCNKFQECYYPERNLAVDESMMPWRGRVSFRQFIPSKPIRYGMKLYCCCESSSGYICSMKLYTGKEGVTVEHGHGPNAVKYVTRDYMHKGHTIYMDSFFSCVALFQDLLADGTSACGTVLKHRKGNPPSLKSKSLKLAKGAFTVRQKGEILAMRFNDRKHCMFLSTIHTATPVRTGKKRKNRDGIEEHVVRPSLVHMYNQHMGGVDNIDQNLSYYAFNRKTMKWWKRAATHLIHIAKVQAHILYKKTGHNVTQLSFTLQLILQLVDEDSGADEAPTDPPAGLATTDPPAGLATTDPPVGPAPQAPPQQNTREAAPMDFQRLKNSNFEHFLQEIHPTQKKKKPTKNCVCCTVYSGTRKQYTHRKETRYQCRICKVALCVAPCHMVYHSVKDYTREI